MCIRDSVSTMQRRGIKVLLAGMMASANLGPAYKKEFEAIYPDISAKYGAPLIPFFMEGIWGHPAMLTADGVHPNAAGIAKIAARFQPYIEKALESLGVKKTAAK
ncbi:MAG: arylesterase, partial [Methylocystis sp.]|nr:arylesterase [Methylocystis sp.]